MRSTVGVAGIARIVGIIWGHVRPIGDIPVYILPMTTDVQLKRREQRRKGTRTDIQTGTIPLGGMTNGSALT